MYRRRRLTMLATTGRDVRVNSALVRADEIGLREIPAVRAEVHRSFAAVEDHPIDHRNQVLHVGRLVGHCLGHNDLVFLVDGRLTVVALDETVAGLPDAAVTVGAVSLR